MLKKYYTEYDEIKGFVDTFNQKANKLLTAHTRKKLTKLIIQLTETPYTPAQHELLCCSSPGLTADIQVDGVDKDGVIHVSLANRRGRDGGRHIIHSDSYRVPYRYVRPHSYRHIAATLATSLFPDGLPAGRASVWEKQITEVLIQHRDITEPVSWGGYVEDKYLAFDYQCPLLKVTAAINDSIIVNEFCLDDISHAVGTRVTLGSYLALQSQLDEMDALCQDMPSKTSTGGKGTAHHLTRQAHHLSDLLRVLRRLTKNQESVLREHLVVLLEDTVVTFDGARLEVVPEIIPTLKLTTGGSEWFIAVSVTVIHELTEPEMRGIPLPAPVVDETPERVVAVHPLDVASADFTSEQNQSLNQLVKTTLTRSGLFLDKDGGVNATELYRVLEASLNETGPILGWFRQKGIYVKYRVKQKPHPVLPTLLIKVDIIKERPVKRNLVNIDIAVGQDDMDELNYVWKMLWMSLIMQADCA